MAAKSSKSSGGERSTPWVEKYRPRNVGDVSHQEEVVRTLQAALKTANMPHMLFYGPPGTGKTTTALAIGQQLFGPELYKTRVMELNASDERGIGVVRHKIKDFAGLAVGLPVAGYPCPPYKLIILDEADSMTEDAQNALRRTMEAHSRVTRFAFICNYVSRMIEPLASRCAKFRFKPLVGDVIHERLTTIATAEGLILAPGTLEALALVAEGDMRRAITTLQSAATLHGRSVTPHAVHDVSCAIPPGQLSGLLAALQQPRALDAALGSMYGLVQDGYPAQQLLKQLCEAVAHAPDIADEQKAYICTKLAEADKCLCDGSDEVLQLMDCAALAVRVLSDAKSPGLAFSSIDVAVR